MTTPVGGVPSPAPSYATQTPDIAALAKKMQIALERCTSQLTSLTPSSAQSDSFLSDFQNTLLAMNEITRQAAGLK